MISYKNWAAIVPMANEEAKFHPFTVLLAQTMDELGTGKVYFVIDNVSKDRTLELAKELAEEDGRFEVIWSPENRSVVDAYLKGLRVAFDRGAERIIEIDAGMSHDPRALPMFLRVLNEGNECAFGSRFINGGSMSDSPFKRRMLSKIGTILANALLGTRMRDMTSGYQGFHRNIVGKLLEYPFKSEGHFYQTEVRYLLRNCRIFEVPIHYKAPSPLVSTASIKNAYKTLWEYFIMRLTSNAPSI